MNRAQVFKHIIGLVLGLVTLTITSTANILQSLQLSCLSYIFGFYILGYVIRIKYNNQGIKWVHFWTLFSTVVLLSMPSIHKLQLQFDAFHVLTLMLIIVSYLIGWANVSIKLSPFLLLGLIGLTYVAGMPVYSKYAYKQQLLRESGIPGMEIHIEQYNLVRPDGSRLTESDFKRDKSTLLIFSFVNCKPCRQQKKVFLDNLSAIQAKYNIVIVQPEYLNDFETFKEESKKYPGLPVYFDVSNEFVELLDLNSRGYPTELRIDSEGRVVAHFAGFANETQELYLEELLKDEIR